MVSAKLSTTGRRIHWRATPEGALAKTKWDCLLFKQIAQVASVCLLAVVMDEYGAAANGRVNYIEAVWNPRTPVYEAVQDLVEISLVNTSTPLWLCNAPKTGCTGWLNVKAAVNLGSFLHGGEFSRNPGKVHTAYGPNIKANWTARALNRLLGQDELFRLLNTSARVVIARNPFVRFVSSFKDWQARNAKMGIDTGNVTFSEFVSMYKENNWGRYFWMRNHIHPVAKHCSASLVQFNVVLRLEDMHLWYDSFIDSFGLRPYMDEMEKADFFMYQKPLNKSEIIWELVPEVLGIIPWVGSYKATSHHRGSADSVVQFYSPDVARMVFDLQRSDFEEFGYPSWNGDPHDFRYI